MLFPELSQLQLHFIIYPGDSLVCMQTLTHTQTTLMNNAQQRSIVEDIKTIKYGVYINK